MAYDTAQLYDLDIGFVQQLHRHVHRRRYHRHAHVAYAAGKGLYGRSRGYHQRILRREQLHGLQADAVLGFRVKLLLLRDLARSDIRVGHDGAAMRTVQKVLLLQKVEILAYGHGRHLQPHTQIGYIDTPRLAQHVKDSLMSFG